ncbi:hypothetical protein RCH20_001822 [Psychrobacter sp. PL15]|nr:hypothetical protein [Psychrobacter sp. PL15]
MNNGSVNNCKLKINAFIMPEYYYYSNTLLQIINFQSITGKGWLN